MDGCMDELTGLISSILYYKWYAGNAIALWCIDYIMANVFLL